MTLNHTEALWLIFLSGVVVGFCVGYLMFVPLT